MPAPVFWVSLIVLGDGVADRTCEGLTLLDCQYKMTLALYHEASDQK